MGTAWSRVLFEKLTVVQLVKKFLSFYGNRRYVHVDRRPPPVLLLSQINPVYTLSSVFVKLVTGMPRIISL
jgi:hypothetical protein